MTTKNAAFAIYRTRAEVERVVDRLFNLGFQNSDIWILQAKEDGAQDFPQVQRSQLLRGAGIGALVGAVIGALLISFYASKTVEYLSTFGMFAGFVAAAFGGAACGALVGIGTPDPAAKRYGQYLQSGGILLSVHGKDMKQCMLAENILMTSNGQEVHMLDEQDTWLAANLENLQLDQFRSRILDA